MRKVITYGTYDLLHEGHLNLLRRAKALGDYLIVGVTADDFDLKRGKINVRQPLMERIEQVKATGLADQIIIEEYTGQKINDILRYDVDVFTVGSDWRGKFDYLKEYCEVVYLDRTEGISSSELRTENGEVRMALVGSSTILSKFAKESRYVNGVKLTAWCPCREASAEEGPGEMDGETLLVTDSLDEALSVCDAVYLITPPERHYSDLLHILGAGKHVLCESPIVLKVEEYDYVCQLARDKGVVLMDGIKTAYATAFVRMLALVKEGRIGDVVSVDATCTSLQSLLMTGGKVDERIWNSMCYWGTTGILPVFDLLGTGYESSEIVSRVAAENPGFDLFSRISFRYPHAVATVKIGQGVKSEGELIISGTKGYIYVPAPWWKPDYFEIRYENPADNLRFFYQLEGEGIRYEILSFVRQIGRGQGVEMITPQVTRAIIGIVEDFYAGRYRRL